jgi:hypothetical protein
MGSINKPVGSKVYEIYRMLMVLVYILRSVVHVQE